MRERPQEEVDDPGHAKEDSMTAAKFIDACGNPQGAVREFEDDLDRLLDDFLLEIAAALPDRYVEVLDDEAVRQIGNVIAVAGARIEYGLEEQVDAAFADFSWKLTYALRTLREKAR
jgi:hypothetical protein